ncbi:2752_t:CDS:2 [Funneliformis geosporum]|nr:2752_t:CDS:2 [Funneliformis geosporum]
MDISKISTPLEIDNVSCWTSNNFEVLFEQIFHIGYHFDPDSLPQKIKFSLDSILIECN